MKNEKLLIESWAHLYENECEACLAGSKSCENVDETDVPTGEITESRGITVAFFVIDVHSTQDPIVYRAQIEDPDPVLVTDIIKSYYEDNEKTIDDAVAEKIAKEACARGSVQHDGLFFEVVEL